MLFTLLFLAQSGAVFLRSKDHRIILTYKYTYCILPLDWMINKMEGPYKHLLENVVVLISISLSVFDLKTHLPVPISYYSNNSHQCREYIHI